MNNERPSDYFPAAIVVAVVIMCMALLLACSTKREVVTDRSTRTETTDSLSRSISSGSISKTHVSNRTDSTGWVCCIRESVVLDYDSAGRIKLAGRILEASGVQHGSVLHTESERVEEEITEESETAVSTATDDTTRHEEVEKSAGNRTVRSSLLFAIVIAVIIYLVAINIHSLWLRKKQ